MRDNIKVPLAIFSAERVGFSDKENADRSHELEAYLVQRGIPYNKAEGVWDGEHEVSFIIHERELDGKLETLLFEVYEQEAILTTDINGAAYLHTGRGGDRAVFGSFTEVPSAVGLKAYTKFGSRVYTVVPFNEGEK